MTSVYTVYKKEKQRNIQTQAKTIAKENDKIFVVDVIIVVSLWFCV